MAEAVEDGVDNCPTTANADQSDTDGDGHADADELAAGSDPLDPASTPEICGGIDNDLNASVDEGFADTDLDGRNHSGSGRVRPRHRRGAEPVGRPKSI